MKQIVIGTTLVSLLLANYTKAVPLPEKKAQPEPDLTIINTIKPDMLKYSFLGASYSPDSFELRVQGKPLKPGQSLSIPKQKKLAVRYDYSFAKGMHTGAKEIEFDLEPQTTQLELTFSWDNKWRICALGAKPQKAKILKYGT